MKRRDAARRLMAMVWAVAAGAVLAPRAAAHGAVPDAPPDALNLLFGWDIEPLVALALLATAIVWWRMLAGIDRLHQGHRVRGRQRWSFLAGLGVVAVAVMSGIARYDTTLFSLHMVQHLLLTLVAPPLLAFGAPVTQLLRASSPSTRRRILLPILHSRVLSVLSHPVVAWILFAAVMWGTHFSPIFNESLENPLIHDLEHGLYLITGLLFWWPVIGLDPAPHRMPHVARIAYVFLQMPQNSFLAVAILFAEGPLYPHYLTLGSPYGITPLDDQRLAAGFMWFFGDIVFLIATVAVLAAWMRHDIRTTEAAERQADHRLADLREREAALQQRQMADRIDQA